MSLLNLQPTVISKDLRSKIIMFYGEPKSGKTTIASKFPNALLAATEMGFNALNGVFAMPITRWSGKTKKENEGKEMSFTEFLKELDNPQIKEKFETIVIDTADNLYQLAEDYVKSTNGVTKIKDIEWGQGYAEAREIFDKALRSIPMKGYGLVIISHAEDKTLKDANGVEYNQYQPTLPAKPQRIINRMADIIGFSTSVVNEDGEPETRLIMRGSRRAIAGSRWKHTPNSIPFEYDALVNTIADAVEKAADEDGVQALDEQVNHYDTQEITFEEVYNEIVELGKAYHALEQLHYFTELMEDTFGVGIKTKDLDKEHTEAMAGVAVELNEKLKEIKSSKEEEEEAEA